MDDFSIQYDAVERLGGMRLPKYLEWRVYTNGDSASDMGHLFLIKRPTMGRQDYYDSYNSHCGNVAYVHTLRAELWHARHPCEILQRCWQCVGEINMMAKTNTLAQGT